MTPDSEMKPCPWCDGKGYHGSEGIGGPNNEHTWTFHINCHDCWIEGPRMRTKAEAIAAWNTRPEILRLEDDLAALREALEPFAKAGNIPATTGDVTIDDSRIVTAEMPFAPHERRSPTRPGVTSLALVISLDGLTVGDFRRARTALKDTSHG